MKSKILLSVLAPIFAFAQTGPVQLMPVPRYQFFGTVSGIGVTVGAPLAAGKVCTYVAGTTTPQQTFTDSTGATPNTNPIVLDASGSANIWLGSNAYKIQVLGPGDTNCPGTGIQQWVVDNVSQNKQLNAAVQNGNNTFTGTNNFANINNVIKCDQSAGANAGAKMAACMATVCANSSAGGVADAIGLQGAQTVAQDVFSGIACPVTLMLGAGTFSASAPQNPGANIRVIGTGRLSTIWQQTVNVTTGGGNTAGDGFRPTGDNEYFAHFTLRGAAGANPPQPASCSTGCGGSKAFIWNSGNKVIIEDMIIDQWAERAIQIGSNSTGIHIHHNTISDIGDEAALFSNGGNATFEVSFDHNECTTWRSFCVDSNSSNTLIDSNYVHDSNNPTIGGLSNASGISCGPLGGQTITGCIIRNNVIANLFAGIQGYIHPWAADTATMQGTVISGNICYSATAGQFCLYSELVGTGTGTINGMAVQGNYGLNASFYTKGNVLNAAYIGNITVSTLADTATGFRFDGLANNGLVATGNTSTGWQTGALTGCTKCIVDKNYFSGRSNDYNNVNVAPWMGCNMTPNVNTTNGVCYMPETNNVLAGFAGEDGIGGLTGGRPGWNGNATGTKSAATLSDQLSFFAAGGAIHPGSVQSDATTNGAGYQVLNTTTTCTTGATAGNTCTTANITLPVAEADTSYRITCSGKGATNVPTVVGTANVSATQFTITIAAITNAAASYSSYDCAVGHN